MGELAYTPPTEGLPNNTLLIETNSKKVEQWKDKNEKKNKNKRTLSIVRVLGAIKALKSFENICNNTANIPTNPLTGETN